MLKAQEVTYGKLLKQLHPDLNPDVKDSAKKIELVKKYKENDRMLLELASKWGIIEEKLHLDYFIEIGNRVQINGDTSLNVIIDVIKNDKGMLDVYVVSDYKNQSFNKVSHYERGSIYDIDLDFEILYPVEEEYYEAAKVLYMDYKVDNIIEFNENKKVSFRNFSKVLVIDDNSKKNILYITDFTRNEKLELIMFHIESNKFYKFIVEDEYDQNKKLFVIKHSDNFDVHEQSELATAKINYQKLLRGEFF